MALSDYELFQGYERDLRISWETTFQLGLLFTGMGFRSSKLLLGPGEPPSVLPLSCGSSLPPVHQDPVERPCLSSSTSLHVPSC